MNHTNIYHQVQKHYGSVARAESPKYSASIAKVFGYSEELNSIPKEANLGVSCGNPLAIASLRKGETVIDLGSGAGFDVFLAAKKVGPHGSVIGIDRNKDMLVRARENQGNSTVASVCSFVEANITSIPLADSTADCIISNCVVNLVPDADKPAVFAEMARLLKPGGRVAISDILARKPLSVAVKKSVTLYVGCVAGASEMDEYKRWLTDAGFSDIAIIDAESDLNVYVTMAKNSQSEDNGDTGGCCGRNTKNNNQADCCPNKEPGCCQPKKQVNCCSRTDLECLNRESAVLSLPDIDINEWAGSFKIFAVKA